jgi:hypothetical protein
VTQLYGRFRWHGGIVAACFLRATCGDAGVGVIRDRSADTASRYVTAFRKGLNETGYIEGQNVKVEYHWLEGRYDHLPELLAVSDYSSVTQV